MTDRLTQIKSALLASGDGHAIDMVKAIEKKASHDPAYADSVHDWLSRKPECGTVFLRDVICAPFENSQIVKFYEKRTPCTFFNMWVAIDSASLK